MEFIFKVLSSPFELIAFFAKNPTIFFIVLIVLLAVLGACLWFFPLATVKFLKTSFKIGKKVCRFAWRGAKEIYRKGIEVHKRNKYRKNQKLNTQSAPSNGEEELRESHYW